MPSPQTPLSQSGNIIFLTGATGFLGVYILLELLTQFPECAIYCLVRRAQDNRLINHMKRHDIWRDEFSPRVIPVEGNLELPYFGLGDIEFTRLAGNFPERNETEINRLLIAA